MKILYTLLFLFLDFEYKEKKYCKKAIFYSSPLLGRGLKNKILSLMTLERPPLSAIFIAQMEHVLFAPRADDSTAKTYYFIFD